MKHLSGEPLCVLLRGNRVPETASFEALDLCVLFRGNPETASFEALERQTVRTYVVLRGNPETASFEALDQCVLFRGNPETASFEALEQ